MAGKSVLVIDTPKDCGDCPCLHDELWMCQADTEHREAEYSGRPSWCQLRHLPELRDEHYQCDNWELERVINAESRGFNWCIDEIMGEKE